MSVLAAALLAKHALRKILPSMNQKKSLKKSKPASLLDNLLLATGLLLLAVAILGLYHTSHRPAPTNCPVPFVAQYI